MSCSLCLSFFSLSQIRSPRILRRSLQEDSGNVADDGNYSVQVCSVAAPVHDLLASGKRPFYPSPLSIVLTRFPIVRFCRMHWIVFGGFL
jgi:hypothetical protein